MGGGDEGECEVGGRARDGRGEEKRVQWSPSSTQTATAELQTERVEVGIEMLVEKMKVKRRKMEKGKGKKEVKRPGEVEMSVG